MTGFQTGSTHTVQTVATQSVHEPGPPRRGLRVNRGKKCKNCPKDIWTIPGAPKVILTESIIDSWLSYAAAAPTTPSELGERDVFSFDTQALTGKKCKNGPAVGFGSEPQDCKIMENPTAGPFLHFFSRQGLGVETKNSSFSELRRSCGSRRSITKSGINNTFG